jgi:pimeloyl-ACP methyl ester carboxylesterase
MSRLRRPDGVEIHWEERGEGPLVVLAAAFFGFPETFEGLAHDLARDHRFVTYHPRGTGSSSRRGPYNIDTDADDLAALIDELGRPALIVCLGDGTSRAVKTAALRPQAVSTVVSAGGNPVGRAAAAGTESLVGSDSVLDALVGMMETDYRAALRTMLDSANPQLDEDALRERVNRTVEHCPHEAAVPRMRSWITDDATEQAQALGNRFWLLEHGQSPWFPIEVARRTRKFLPEAHIEEVEDGPLTRPDIFADLIRQLTAADAAGGPRVLRGPPVTG